MDLAPQLSETDGQERAMWDRITACETCEFRHSVSEKRPPWRWLCIKHKRLPWSNMIRPDGTWEPGFDPYLPCERVNGGACPLYEPKKEQSE